MNKAIVTPRTLKNTETGIDITVPEYRTISKLLSTQEEYHVIVISNLPYFKSPHHKPEDVVQFMVPKWYSDFESLHKAMSDRYPATIFPELPKKVLMVKDSTPQGRRAAFEKLMQFIAASPKVCCSPIFLEFLGVPSSKITDVQGKEKESESQGSGDGAQKEDLAKTISPTKSVKSQSSSLFGEEDSDDELFKTENADADEADSDLFSPSPHHAPKSSGGGAELILTADDTALSNSEIQESLFLPSGASTDVASSDIVRSAQEDNSELLNVEDDLDNLLTLSTQPKSSPSKAPLKPRPLPKPSGTTSKSSIPQSSMGALDQSESDQMAEDDILKYIQENCESGDAKLDLF